MGGADLAQRHYKGRGAEVLHCRLVQQYCANLLVGKAQRGRRSMRPKRMREQCLNVSISSL